MNNYDFVFEYEYAQVYHCRSPLFWKYEYDRLKYWAYRPARMLMLYNIHRPEHEKQILFYRFLKKSSFQEFTHVLDCFVGDLTATLVRINAQKYLSQEKLLYLKLL
jgi:hypothetical protein